MHIRAPWLAGAVVFASCVSYVACGGGDSSSAGGGVDSGVSDGAKRDGATCDAPKTKCPSGACLDLQTDPRNCGTCAYDCKGGTCAAGVCQPEALVSNLNTPSNLAILLGGLFVTETGGNRVLRYDQGDGGVAAITGGVASPWGIAPGPGGVNGLVHYGEAIADSASLIEAICDPSGCSNGAPVTLDDSYVRGMMDDGSGNVFWADEMGDGGARIRYHNFNMGTLLDLITGEVGAYGLLYAGFGGMGYVYYTLHVPAGKVRRVGRDGSNPVDWVTNLSSPEGLTSDSDTLWIADTGANRIAACPLQTGCSLSATTFAAAQNPHAIIIDDVDTNVYWSNGVDPGGSIQWCPKAGCPASGPSTLASNQSNPLGVIVDENYVYWVNSTATGTVMRLRLP